MNQTGRIYFLDNLRAFVIVLVVILHGSMVYMVGAPEWWYVVDAQNSLFFTSLVFLIDVPIMLIMFFIAGYFAMPSLVKRGPDQFLRDKFIRVGAPWLVGVFFLAPLTAYMVYIKWGNPMTYLQFWTTDFWAAAFQQSVYWYLGVLFSFFFLLVLACDISERLRNAKRQLSVPTWKLFLSFWALMSLGMFLMNQFFPVGTWYTQVKLLVFQPLRVPLYIGYFALGIYAHLSGWFSDDGYQPRLLPWTAVWLISGLLYLANRMFVMPANPDPAPAIQAPHALLFNAFCLSSLMAGTAFFQQFVNKSTRFWHSLSANSYGIYYIHPLILYPLAYLFLPVSLPLFVKAPLVILLGLSLSWAASAFVLTKAPIVRRAFA